MGNFINEAIKHSIEIREDYNHAKHNTKRLRSKDVL
jgi:predicted DNA-binding protein